MTLHTHITVKRRALFKENRQQHNKWHIRGVNSFGAYAPNRIIDLPLRVKRKWGRRKEEN